MSVICLFVIKVWCEPNKIRVIFIFSLISFDNMSNINKKNLSRARGPNFTNEEVHLLLNCMEPYIKIIECKKTDTVKQADKQRAWQKITEIFNANTKGTPRNTENLLGCYRNSKSKLKKGHSSAKMLVQDNTKKEQLISALDENGEDWETIALQVNEPIPVCKKGFEDLKKELKKEEAITKHIIMGTGGGPSPLNDRTNSIYKIQKFIEPQIDGLFTIYDGDASLMSQFQQSLPEEERIEPIEQQANLFLLSDIDNVKGHNDNEPSTTRIEALANDEENTVKKKTTNESFKLLANEKLELVQLQKELLQLEREHKIKMFELEYKLKVKEIELMEIKIRNETK